MNQALADNIRALRSARLDARGTAEAARVHHRTIQRAEAAQGASAETLLAIAGAFNVDRELLRFDGMEFWHVSSACHAAAHTRVHFAEEAGVG
jgi:hypothetical protein